MADYVLEPPLTEADVRQLRLEDTVLLNGTIFGLRDATQIRIFDEGVAPPPDLTGAVCLHTAPGVRRRPDGTFEKVSIGTTTSTRMDRFVPGLLERYGVRAIQMQRDQIGPLSRFERPNLFRQTSHARAVDRRHGDRLLRR